jgi:hypothetical protein
MESTDPPAPCGPNQSSSTAQFQARRNALQTRVSDSARALLEKGIRPTVSRIRAALGGGSPNDLAPALKHWKEVVLPTLSIGEAGRAPATAALPVQVADLVHELWLRALAAAVVEVRGGQTAQAVAARTAEAQSLRQQITVLRDQLQRESLAYGELRAQAARHEALAREALTRAHEADTRERDLLHETGVLRQRVSMLEAAAVQTSLGRRSRSMSSNRGARKLKSPSLPRARLGSKRRAAKRAKSRVRRRPVPRSQTRRGSPRRRT